MSARPDGEVISDTPRRKLVVIAERPEMSITWTRYAGGQDGIEPDFDSFDSPENGGSPAASVIVTGPPMRRRWDARSGAARWNGLAPRAGSGAAEWYLTSR
jgi:hypothetical protein